MAFVPVVWSCKIKVSNLCIEVGIKEDIGRFEITMDDVLPRISVEIRKATSDPSDDVKPFWPVQLLTVG